MLAICGRALHTYFRDSLYIITCFIVIFSHNKNNVLMCQSLINYLKSIYLMVSVNQNLTVLIFVLFSIGHDIIFVTFHYNCQKWRFDDFMFHLSKMPRMTFWYLCLSLPANDNFTIPLPNMLLIMIAFWLCDVYVKNYNQNWLIFRKCM